VNTLTRLSEAMSVSTAVCGVWAWKMLITPL
jgi:hypothetical protein